MLSLKESNGVKYFVYMVLGIDDGIKTQRTKGSIYGLRIQDFLNRTGVSVEDVGWTKETCEGDCLWTAKIHPKVQAGTSFESVFGWISELFNTSGDISKHPSFLKWLSSSRASLKELHSLANAETEWSFRKELELRVVELQRQNYIPYLRDVLQDRCHDKPCHLDWLLEMEDRLAAAEELKNILDTLEEIACEELEQGRFDICGRAFMIASALLADFDSVSDEPKDIKVGKQVREFCALGGLFLYPLDELISMISK